MNVPEKLLLSSSLLWFWPISKRHVFIFFPIYAKNNK